MPVYLKELKDELQSDRDKVGKNPDGSYKFTPPSIVGRKIKDYANLKVSKLTSKAVPRLKWVTYTGLVTSQTTAVKYKVSVQFNDMQFKDVESKQFSLSSPTRTSDKLYHRKPTAQKNQVRIKCSCQDFRHRFETQLAIFNALIGGPRSYTRVTRPWPIGYPSVNSTDKIGFCKHVSSILNHLKAKNIVKER